MSDNTIVIHIDSTFDPKGFEQATRQIDRLLSKSLQTMTTGHMDKTLKQIGETFAKIEGEAKAAAKATKQLDNEQEKVAKSTSEMVREAQRMAKIDNVVEDLIKSSRAYNKTLEESKDLSQELRKAQQDRLRVEERSLQTQKRAQDLLESGNKDTKQRAALERELADLSRQREAAAKRVATAEQKLNSIVEKGNDAAKSHTRLTGLMDSNVDVRGMRSTINALNEFERARDRVFSGTSGRQGGLFNPQTLGVGIKQVAADLDRLDVTLDDTRRALQAYDGSMEQAAAAAKDLATAQREQAKVAATARKEAEASDQRLVASNRELAASRKALETSLDKQNALNLKASQLEERLAEQMSAGTLTLKERLRVKQQLESISQQQEVGARQAAAAESRYNNAVAQNNVAVRESASAQNRLQSSLSGSNQALSQTYASTARLSVVTASTAQVIQRMQTSFRQINSAAQNAMRGLSSLMSIISRLAGVLSGAFLGAVNRAAAGLGRLASSGASRFASLRSNLDATGKSFGLLGRQATDGMSRVERAIERTTAGWGLLLAGQSMSQMGQTMFRNAERALGGYLDFEKASTLAAVATLGTQNMGGDAVSYIQDMAFGVARGRYSEDGRGVKNLSLEQIAQGIYYYGSAVGQDINPQNEAALMKTITPMLQLAGFTQTSPETTIKGVLNAAQQFGIDPRDITNSGNLGRISELYGFLANATSMEVPDISNFFKMVGPLAHSLSPKGVGGSLTDIMTSMYIASDYGLRGGSAGRGMQQLLQTLISPSGPANGAAMDIWGMGMREKFFDSQTGKLKGDGLVDVVAAFAELDEGQWKIAQADIFTNNASRFIVPLIEEYRKTGREGWDNIAKTIESGEFLGSGFDIASQTLNAALQDTGNAWTELVSRIVGSVRPEATSFLSGLATGLREIADIVHGAPALGKFFTALYAGIASALAIGGALLTTAGAALVLQRAFLIAGQGAGVLMTVLRSIPFVLGISLPIIAAIAAGLLALKVAWDSNFLGLRDGFKAVKGFFSANDGDFSFTFFEALNSDKMKSVYTWAMRIGAAFKELISGIFFNTGGTNNLFALINKVLGPMLGPHFNLALDTARVKLSALRDSIKDFFTGAASGLPSLGTVGKAIRGLAEDFMFGVMSTDGQKGWQDIGEKMGIEDLDKKVHAVMGNVRTAFNTTVNVIIGFANKVRGLLGQIFANISQAFTLDNLIAAFRLAQGVITGFAAVVGAAVLGVLKAIEWVTRGFGELGFAVNSLGLVIGAVLGGALVTRLMLAIAPIRMMISLVGQLGLSFVALIARTVAWGAAIAAAGVRWALFTGASAVFQGLTWSITAAGTMMQAFSVATGNAAARMAVFSVASLGIAGIVLALGAALIAYIAFTQGIDRAIQVARSFAEGFISGMTAVVGATVLFGRAIVVVVQSLARIVNGVASVLGLGDAFMTADSAAKMLGFTLAIMLGASFAGMIGKMIAGVFALTSSLGKGQGAFIRFAAAAMLISAAAPYFDPVISKIKEMFEWLGMSSGAADKLGTALSLVGGAGLAAAAMHPVATMKKGGQYARSVGKYALAGASTPVGMAALGVGAIGGIIAYDLMTPEVQKQDDWWGLRYSQENNAGVINSPRSRGRDFASPSFTAGLDRKDNFRLMEYYASQNDPNYRPSQATIDLLARAGTHNQQQEIFNAQQEYFQRYGTFQGIPTQYAPDRATQDKIMATMPGGVNYGFNEVQIGTSNPNFVPELGGTAAFHGTRSGQKLPQTPKAANPAKESNKAFSSVQKWMNDTLSAFGIQDPKSMLSSFGLNADGGFSLDSFWRGNQLGQYGNRQYTNTKFDEQLLDFLPDPAKQFYADQANYADYQTMLDNANGDSTAAMAQWMAHSGGKPPPSRPKEFASYFGEDATSEEVERIMAEAAAEAEAYTTHIGDVQMALQELDLPTAMRAMFSGPSFLNNGNLGRGVSGAEALMSYSDQFLSNFGDTAPWMNQQEMLADMGIEGLIQSNMGGVNMHRAMKPLIEKWSRETGLSVDELMTDIPRFFHDPKYMTMATTDLAKFFSSVPENTLAVMDTLGAGKYEEFGLQWADLTQFAISQGMSGNTDWDFADYIMQAWDLTRTEAEAYIKANGLDPNVISGEMFGNLQGHINSQGGQVVALTTEWWDYLNAVTADGTDNMIEISQAAYSALPDYVKLAYAQMGYQFVVGGQMNADQAAANVEMMESIVRDQYPEAFAAIADEVRKGNDAVLRVAEDGTRWVDIMDEATGKTYTIPEVLYLGWKDSLDQSTKIANDWADNFNKAMDKVTKEHFEIVPPTTPPQNFDPFGPDQPIGDGNFRPVQTPRSNEPPRKRLKNNSIGGWLDFAQDTARTVVENRPGANGGVPQGMDPASAYQAHGGSAASAFLAGWGNPRAPITIEINQPNDMGGAGKGLAGGLLGILGSDKIKQAMEGMKASFMSSPIEVPIGATTTDFDLKTGMVQLKGAMIASTPYDTPLGATTTDFDLKTGLAQAKGQMFSTLRFTSTLGGNNAPFTLASQLASLQGQNFGSRTFRAALAASSSAFDTALGGARARGQGFAAAKYSASIGANTGAFFSAVAGIAGRTVGTAYINVQQRLVGGAAFSGAKGWAGGRIGNYATGGRVSLVGEFGPELVKLPIGSHVMSSTNTSNLLNGPNGVSNQFAQALRGPSYPRGANAKDIIAAWRNRNAPTVGTTPSLYARQSGGNNAQSSGGHGVVNNFNIEMNVNGGGELTKAKVEAIADTLVTRVEEKLAKERSLAQRGQTSGDDGREY